MTKTTITTTEIKWDLPGSGNMSAIIENGKITSLQMCEEGSNPNGCLISTNVKHLKNIHKALGLLIDELEGPRIEQPSNGI